MIPIMAVLIISVFGLWRLEDHLLTQQLFAWRDVIANSNKLSRPPDKDDTDVKA